MSMVDKRKIIGFLCSVVFCIAIAAGMPQVAKAAGEVAINETNFPDETFRNYVKNNFDKDSNNELSEEEIADAKEISVEECGITSLTGIEHFTALTTLDCDKNQLTDLDLSKNTALTELYCYYNQLTALDLSRNTALTDLDCHENRLTSLDLSNNTDLYNLYCSYNQITSLDLSKNTALVALFCYSTQLTSLDLSKNTALKSLICFCNQLTSLDLTKNTDLELLECDFTQLTSLDLSKNIALQTLKCNSNKLTSLDLSNNTVLQRLECFDNPLTELKLNSQTYDKLSLYKRQLHGDNAELSFLQNITETATDDFDVDFLLKVTDITKPATYKVNGKDFTIIYAEKASMPGTPTATPIVPSDTHIFSDYSYSNPVSGTAVIYGNGINKKVNGIKVNNKELVLYTDILASYKYTLNNSGIVKPAVGKVIVAVTTTNEKPVVEKNKVKDTSASKIARAKIKNGQITVTAVGKEGGLVYLWVIDTGDKGVSACCPVDVKLAPKKLEVQDTSGNKLTNTKLQNGMSLDVHIGGFSGQVKTEDCTYTATVDSKSQQYASVVPKGTDGKNFTITANGLKGNKNTKATIIFICDQNGKKLKFSFTITK